MADSVREHRETAPRVTLPQWDLLITLYERPNGTLVTVAEAPSAKALVRKGLAAWQGHYLHVTGAGREYAAKQVPREYVAKESRRG